MQVQFLGEEDPLEDGTETRSFPGRRSSVSDLGSQEYAGHNGENEANKCPLLCP